MKPMTALRACVRVLLCVLVLLPALWTALLSISLEGVTVVQATPVRRAVPVQRTDGTEIILQLEIAADEQARARGLMHRTRLPSAHGMVFIWPAPQPVSMWMKNTPLSLDMIFVDDARTVVHIHRGAVPLTETRIRSPLPVRAVIELPAGDAERLRLTLGARINKGLFIGAGW